MKWISSLPKDKNLDSGQIESARRRQIKCVSKIEISL